MVTPAGTKLSCVNHNTTNSWNKCFLFLTKGREGCMNLVLTRGKGVQNPENLVDVIYVRPLRACSTQMRSAHGTWQQHRSKWLEMLKSSSGSAHSAAPAHHNKIIWPHTMLHTSTPTPINKKQSLWYYPFNGGIFILPALKINFVRLKQNNKFHRNVMLKGY